MFMRSPEAPTVASNHSLVSCGQILCYDLGWNRGQAAGIVDQHCPAAVDTLPVSIDNRSIVNRTQVDAYCNGFANGQQAATNNPGVSSHVDINASTHNNITCNDFHQCVNGHMSFTFHCDLPNNSNFTCMATHYHWYFNNTMKALPEQKMLGTNSSAPITCIGNVAMPNCI
jgi:hypothetical protein